MSQELIVSNPKELLAYLQKSKSAISMALPAHLNADRMCRLALTCFSTSPKLRKCTPNSILASVVVASQLGLEPGVAGQGYLIPYKETCTFVPGWQGLVGLLNNTGRATAWTGAVFEGDTWEFEQGSTPKCKHIPNGTNNGDPAKLIWVYACGKVNGSEIAIVEAWPMHRVWKHRDRYNKVGDRHYSYEHKEMYARKVVLLQVLKYLPRSVELSNAILATEAAEMGRTTRVEQGATRDDSIILEVESEVEDKFDTRKADPPKPTENAGATQTGAQQSIGTAPDEDAAETQREIEESKRKAADLATAKAAEAEKAKAALKTDKPKAPPWDSAKDKPSLLAWLARDGITQAQVCGYVKSKFAGFDDCMTIDAVEALATKPLANILFKFDAIKAEIAAMPGKSAV